MQFSRLQCQMKTDFYTASAADWSITPIPKFDDRFACQNGREPPPEFPLDLSSSGTVFHLSSPNSYARTQIRPKNQDRSPMHPERYWARTPRLGAFDDSAQTITVHIRVELLDDKGCWTSELIRALDLLKLIGPYAESNRSKRVKDVL